MASLQEIMADPDFVKLSEAARVKVLQSVGVTDPNEAAQLASNVASPQAAAPNAPAASHTAPGLGPIRFDPSVPPEQQQQILASLGAQPAPQAAPSAPAQPTKPMTAADFLSQDNRPLSKGLSTTAKELSEGVNNLMGGGSTLDQILSPAKIVFAPTVGAGDAVGTMVQNSLARVPGLGGAEGVVPAAGAAIANAGTQLASGQAVGKMAMGLLRAGGKAIGSISNPGLMRETGVELVAKKLGQPGSTIERFLKKPASKTAFEAVDAKAGEVLKAQPIQAAVGDVLTAEAQASTPSGALARLQKLHSKLGDKTVTYDWVQREAKSLQNAARDLVGKDSDAAASLRDARQVLLKALGTHGDELATANRLTLSEKNAGRVIDNLRSANPGVQIRKLLDKQPALKGSLDKDKVDFVTNMADYLSDIPTATPTGSGRLLITAATEPIGQLLANPILKKLIVEPTLRGPHTVRGVATAPLSQQIGLSLSELNKGKKRKTPKTEY
jgi:hypothetical protein